MQNVMDDEIPCDENGRPLRFWWWTSGIGEDEDHELALKHVAKLMDMNPPLLSPHGDMLDYWAKEISDYEERRWPIDR